MARHTPAKFKPNSCQRLRHVDAPIIRNPEHHWAVNGQKMSFGAVKAMQEAEAYDNHWNNAILGQVCPGCGMTRSVTNQCWCN